MAAPLHEKLTREIREGPAGPKVAAFFDVDRTLLAGFSAAAFLRERLVTGRISPREMAVSVLGTLGYWVSRSSTSTWPPRSIPRRAPC